MTKKYKRLRVHAVRVSLEDPEGYVDALAKKLNLPADDLLDVELVKRTLDARKRPIWNCSVDVSVPLKVRSPKDSNPAPDPLLFAQKSFRVRKFERIVVIGAGPCGLFAANMLAEHGLNPILLDRGDPVETRARKVSRLMHYGELDPESNICYGEGGAGTWSDGKLYTRIKDKRSRHVLETIVKLGGPERILVDGKPHLGTNRLVALCKAFRARLTDLGAEVRFQSRVVGFSTESGRVVGVKLDDGTRIPADRVILAVGHSARDMYRTLYEMGVKMEAKPFAVGFRVEHKQQLINEIQYGAFANAEGIPAADYKLATNFEEGDRRIGVYSFCMCPGGQVVPSHTKAEEICVNGMSHASRKGHFANSALIVAVDKHDFGSDLFSGMEFQQEAEGRAYALGGGGFIAPAQRLQDFVDGKKTGDVSKSTYKPGIAAADLSLCYPDFVNEKLRAALKKFDVNMSGYLTNDATLIGVETRTSAPLKISRNDRLQSMNYQGLYPAGEGAGYGGGIVSAAVDGLRVAEQILAELSDGYVYEEK